MIKELAQYLTILIATDIEKNKCLSSYELEKVEQTFIEENFEEIEKWLKYRTKEIKRWI